MNPLDRIARPDTDMLVTAGRELAWNGGMEIDVMDSLIRKVSARAKANVIRMLCPVPDNDPGGTG